MKARTDKVELSRECHEARMSGIFIIAVRTEEGVRCRERFVLADSKSRSLEFRGRSFEEVFRGQFENADVRRWVCHGDGRRSHHRKAKQRRTNEGANVHGCLYVV